MKPPIPQSPPLPPPATHRKAAWGLALIAALLALWTYTQANTFPASYHPDEPSKARQVIGGEFNFHHPMLMLSAAKIAVAISGAGDDVQRVTEAGRWVSAIFTATAVGCLVLLAALSYGPLAGAFAGALLVTNHHLFELAHYFKEDPAVLLGVSAFFLALTVFDRAPGFKTAALLGLGTGLAISGKYVGALVVPFALTAIFISRGKPASPRASGDAPASAHRRTMLPVWLVATAATFALANLPIFLNPTAFAAGFDRELEFAVHGHKGITREIPHGVYGAVFRESTNPAIWILLIVFALDLLRRWRTARPAEWMLAIFPLFFAVVLSFSPKTHHRYFLPATGLLLAMAGAAITLLPRLRLARWPAPSPTTARLIMAAALVITIGIQAPHYWRYFDGFSNDGREKIARYIRANVPPTAVIISDKRVNLRELGLPNPIEGKLFAADVGTLAELRARGISHVAVAEGDYGRFFRDKLKPTEKGAENFAQRKAFYAELFDTGTLLLDSPPGQLQYLQPHLQLWALTPNAVSADPERAPARRVLPE